MGSVAPEKALKRGEDFNKDMDTVRGERKRGLLENSPYMSYMASV